VSFITSAAYFPESMRRKESSWKTEVSGIQLHVLNVPYDHLMPFRERVRSFLRFYRQAKAYAKKLSAPDIIYASSTPLTVGELGRKLSRKWGVPFVYECVDVWPDVPIGMGYIRNPFLKWWLYARTNRIYREAASIVTLSEGMRAQVLDHPAARPQKTLVVHNGCDTEAFPYIARTPGEVVEVIYTGTVGLANGVDALVRAAHAIGKTRHDIRFTILGGGNDLTRVRALADELDCPNLRFVDRVPKEEVAGMLQGADIGVVTFAPFKVLEANSANKFYDYLASGLPVVINYQGWQADYLNAYRCGLSGYMGDQQGFVDNILHLADDPDLRREMGKRGRKLAEDEFDRGKLALKLLDVFGEVLEAH
jgi:glycosyltransferase involved in cell wall biosynthesis